MAAGCVRISWFTDVLYIYIYNTISQCSIAMIITDLYVQSVAYLQWISDKHHVAAVYVEDVITAGISCHTI